jgi:peptidoglycan/LPS O-acetylase OafA/YrhL
MVTAVIVFPALVALTIHADTSAPRVCNLLGNLSYPVYILHVPILAVTLGASHALLAVDLARYQPWGGVVFVTVIAMAAILTDRAYDVPFRRWLTRRLLP